MEQGTMPSFPAGTRREEVAQVRREMMDDFFKPECPDQVNHPPHYADNGPTCPHCGNTVECITITERMGFCLGNAVKYIWRKDAKGNALEDLRKARWYIDREIARMEAECGQ
jgi:hypothetical protein